MKKFLIIFGIVILLVIIVFSIFKIREYIDAHTEFELNDNKFILVHVEFPEKNGRVSTKYYYEINLEEKTVDYRKDVDYFDDRVTNWFEKTFGNKKRKLVHRYRINDEIVSKLKNLFTEYSSIDYIMDDKDFSYLFYYIKTKQGNFKINDNNMVNQILNELKK